MSSQQAQRAVPLVDGPTGAPSGHPVVHVDEADAAHLWHGVEQVRSGAYSAHDEVTIAAIAAVSLPLHARAGLRRFGERGSASNALLVRGLLPPRVTDALPPTPATLFEQPDSRAAQQCGLVLLAAMTVIGAPFTFATLHQGRIVQNVAPVAGQEDTQTSGGTTSLDWHVEDAFSDDRCDHVGLLCLRGAPEAETLSSTVGADDLDPSAVRVLRQPRFGIVPDVAHGASTTASPVTVLEGPDDDLELRTDAVYLAPLDLRDHVAETALLHLHQRLGEHAQRHVMIPGDLLVLDNRRAAHARTTFRPRHDGRDRWLLRVMTTADGRSHRRRQGARTI